MWKRNLIVFLLFFLYGTACVPNAIRQKYYDEEMWLKASKKTDIDYYFSDVTPVNFQELFADSEERFRSTCNWDLTIPEYENYRYRLGVGDEVLIKLNALTGDTKYFSKFGKDLVIILPSALTTSVVASYKVSTDGHLSLPYIGKTQAEGMTTSQIEDLLLQQLSVYYNESFVEVKLTKYQSQWVQVAGAVLLPQRLAIDSSPMTVQRALIKARKFMKGADLRGSFVRRGEEKIPIDLYALLYEGETAFNIRMQAGDILVIPETKRDRIYLTGEVFFRRVIETDFHAYTLSDILITNRDAVSVQFNNSKNLVYVYRSKGLRKETNLCPSYEAPERPIIEVFKFDLRMPQMLVIASSFQLQHNDIVFISTTTPQMWRRTLDLLVRPIGSFLGPFLNPRTYAD